MSSDDFYLPPDSLRRRLRKQEIRILRLAAMGMSDAMIAWLLDISHHTMKNHNTHIYDALGLKHRNQTAAVVEAWRLGIL